MTERSKIGLEIEAALREAVAHRKGEIVLPVTRIETMSKERVRAIRKAWATSPKAFEQRFGIPARTIEGWEQGRRRPDPAASILLKIIETDPEVAERAAHAE